MTDQRPPPQNTIQAVGAAASDVVAGLKVQPMLLGLIVLNIIAVAAALWFLNRLVDHGQAKQKEDRETMQQILAACLPKP